MRKLGARLTGSRLATSPVAWPPAAVFVGAALVYWLLATSAYELFGALSIGVTFFPPAGFTFAAFFALPRRLWPAVALAIIVAEIAVDTGQGQGFWWACGWAVANLTEPLVGALVARRLGATLDLNRRTAFAIVVGGLVIGPTVGAAIGATTLAIANDLEWIASFTDVWVGDSLGVLIVAPAALLFGVVPARSLPSGRARWEAALLAAAVLVICVLFWTSDEPAVAYAAIPLLAWCALRTGPRGLALAALAIATAATYATAHEHGPWQRIGGADVHDQLGHQQFFLLVAVGGAWLLTLEVRERARAVEDMHTIASDAALLRRALQAGRMGVWRWTIATGEIEWDEDLERLYGLEPGTFDGTFEAWSELVHPDDRPQVLQTMRDAMATRGVFRVEHACVWPDGSVHAIEGVGEVVLDEEQRVIGAFGVSVDIDHRRQADIERSRSLELERRARQRSEMRAQVNAAIGFTLDVEDLADRVARAAVSGLADWSSLVLTLDQPNEQPIVATAHTDPATLASAAAHQQRFPIDLRSPHRTSWVLRTGKTAFAPQVDQELLAAVVDDDAERAAITALDVRSSLVVALPSPLGVLGAWELVRTGDSPPYTDDDVALAEDLARTVGAALNSAVLHRRQLRARRALETLQRVTGRLATALTVDEIIHAVVTHGAEGTAADSAMLYLLDENGLLDLSGTAGLDHLDVTGWQRISLTGTSPVADAVNDRKVIVLSSIDEMRARYPTMPPPSADEAAVIALPLFVRNESVGALVLTYRRARFFHDEELAMLETLAGRCAGAIMRARLYEIQRTAALALQRRLLPQLPDLPPWLDVGAQYEPGSGGAVGGDWYQVMMLADGRCAAALGDAVGRGITAAAAMGQLRAAIAGAAGVDAHPSPVVAATSRLAAAGEDTQCASLAYAVIDPTTATLTYSLAGHPSPVLLRAGGQAELLDHGRGPLLGTLTPTDSFPFAVTDFGPGDALVLFSDGLVERRGESIDDGLQRLARHVVELAHLPAADMARQLIDVAVPPDTARDDIAVLVLRHRPAT